MDNSKLIRRDMRGVCLCVGGFILLMYIFSAIVLYLPIFAESGIESGVASVIGMVCALPIFLIIRGKKFVTTDITAKNSTPTFSTIVILFVVILGIQFTMTLIELAFEPLLNAGGGSLVDDLQSGTAQLTSSFWGIIYMVLVAPVCEELVFRGAVLRKLEKHGANFAIITSSLLFGLYHVILFQAVFAFFIGVILAYTAGRFSIKWSILLHMLNNILAVMSFYFNVLAFYLALVYLFAFLATLFIYFFSRELIAAQKVAGASVLPNIYATAYVSPWLIAYIILCVGSGTLLLGII